MVTPVFITQTQDDDQSFLSDQIHDLKLLDTTSMSTLTKRTSHFTEECTASATALLPFEKGFAFPIKANCKSDATPTTSKPLYLNSETMFPTTSFSPETVRSISSPNITTCHTPLRGITLPNHSNTTSSEEWECCRAQPYYEHSCKNNPRFLLAMAHDVINPQTGFPFSHNSEPFISYYKKNEFKVGNNNLICEVIRRARLDTGWVGGRWGNNDQPQPKSWSKTKCLEWLSNNPIKNDIDYQYIVDTVTKLIQSVCSSNQERVGFHSTNNLGQDKIALASPLVSLSTIPIDSQCFLMEKKPDSDRNRTKIVTKRNGSMDPETFKLLIAHQKEYTLQAKEIQSHDPVTINRKKKWNTFWTAATKKARKKKRNVKFVWEKKEQAAQKAEVDFLERLHDLKTPMLLSDN